MSENTIESLHAEIARLNGELKSARQEAANYRSDRSGKLKSTAEELESLRSEHAKLQKKLETLPGELQGEVDRLKGEIRTRDHKSKFSEVAKELNVRPEALDDLWSLSGYKAEKDDVDVDALKATISEAVGKRPYLLAEGQAQDAAPAPAPRSIPGGGQGAKPQNPAGGFVMTKAQNADPAFLRDNAKSIQEAAKAGLLKIR
jgi:FtsZ-binding cell division protein ZapB